MTRSLKATGLALVALLAMGALVAGAAQAEIQHTFHSEAAKTILTGSNTGEEVFSAGGGLAKVSCTSAKFEGTLEGKEAKSVTVTPTYGSTTAPSGCKDSISGKEAIIHTNHCAYVLFSNTTIGTNSEHAKVEIECSGTSENEITVTIPALKVTLHIPAQVPGEGGVHYNQIEDPEKSGKTGIQVVSTVKKIKYTCTEETGGSGLCGFLGGKDGTYNGTTDTTGYEDQSSAALTGTEKTTPVAANTKEGAQVNLTLTTP